MALPSCGMTGPTISRLVEHPSSLRALTSSSAVLRPRFHGMKTDRCTAPTAWPWEDQASQARPRRFLWRERVFACCLPVAATLLLAGPTAGWASGSARRPASGRVPPRGFSPAWPCTCSCAGWRREGPFGGGTRSGTGTNDPPSPSARPGVRRRSTYTGGQGSGNGRRFGRVAACAGQRAVCRATWIPMQAVTTVRPARSDAEAPSRRLPS